jgi:hypothetical protein
MRISEKGWGLIYLVSGIFGIIISIWDFPIALENSHLILFDYYNILLFILGLSFSLVFIGLSVKSFKFSKLDYDIELSTNIVSKIGVWVFNLYQVIMIGITINYILYW